jgi:hypothetical protein
MSLLKPAGAVLSGGASAALCIRAILEQNASNGPDVRAQGLLCRERSLDTNMKTDRTRKPKEPRSRPSATRAAANRPAATTEHIARRAYELFELRGAAHGHDWDDWLSAERELGASD